MSLVDKIKKHQEETKAKEESFAFADYLEIVRNNRLVAQRSHQRIYHMIKESGILERENGKKEYQFFSKEIFGLEDVFEQLVDEYFKPAALGLDVRKRLLMLMGPVSGGKSSILMLLKKGMEEYSKTENGAVYAIDGCPMNQEPLLLLPQELRNEFEQELGIKIEGELNPYTRWMVEDVYKGNILEVPVKRIFFSEKNRVGIGTFSPSDPKSQDISELIGSIDFSTITTYGSESDPRAYRFDGELNIANRGLMEFQEILKCDEKFLWHLLSLTQEGNFKIGRFALVDADEVIIAHTNEAEYKTFIANKKNEALISRMKVIKVPYNVNLEAEEKIYQKAIHSTQMDVEVVPLALKAVATFSILTRLKDSEAHDISLVQKLSILNGEVIRNITEDKVKSEFLNEAMTGIDPRFVINAISTSIIKNDGILDGLETLTIIQEKMKHIPGITQKEVEHYLYCVDVAIAEYFKEAEKVFIKMFEDQTEKLVKGLLENYVSELENLHSGKGMNYALLREVEVCMEVSESEAPEFRDTVAYQVNKLKENGKSFDLTKSESLKDIVKKVTYAQTKKYISFNEENAEKAIKEIQKKQGCKKEVAARLVNQLINSFK